MKRVAQGEPRFSPSLTQIPPDQGVLGAERKTWYIAGMFIRRTQTRTTDSRTYFTHRLVESKRVGKKIKQVTLLNLGRHFAIPKEQWCLLCARVEQIVGHQAELFSIECPEEVEQEAQRIAAQLLARQAGPAVQDVMQGAVQPDIQSVDIDWLELSRPRSVGVEQAALWAMELVGFEQILEEIGLNRPQRMAAIGSIVGRMAAPGSESATHRWLGGRSGLGELLDMDYETMSLMQLYRVSDLLIKHKEQIEKRLFFRLEDLFGLSCTVTLYDLTNTYFEGGLEGNPKAKRGHSKEKRSDCPLLTLGLVLDGSGFVRRSQVFTGAVSECKTLEGMLLELDVPAGALIVMDRGLSTEANLTRLRDNGFRYLVVSRRANRQDVDLDEAVLSETRGNQKVHVRKDRSEDGREAFLYCLSEDRAKKEEGIFQRFAERFEAGLQKLADGLSRPRTTKKLDRIHERIGRLKEASRGVSQHYHITVVPDESGARATAIHWERIPRNGTMATHPGIYCLRTNETSWDEARLWHTCVMLTDLEAVFRTLKSEPGLRPIYHQKEARGDGHLFITVLAYQFVQIIRHRLRSKGIVDRWATLRGVLGGMCRVTATFRRADGRILHVRKATRPDPEHRAVIQALGLPGNPGGTQKTVV